MDTTQDGTVVVYGHDELKTARDAHAKRVQALEAKLKKLERDVIETRIAIDNERRLVAEDLAKTTRRFGLLALLNAGQRDTENRG